jgi:hypothetical protein
VYVCVWCVLVASVAAAAAAIAAGEVTPPADGWQQQQQQLLLLLAGCCWLQAGWILLLSVWLVRTVRNNILYSYRCSGGSCTAVMVLRLVLRLPYYSCMVTINRASGSQYEILS